MTSKNISENSLEVLVAIIGNLTNEIGYSLIKTAEALDDKTIGKCIVKDADVDVLTLLDWAREHKVKQIDLVFPATKCHPTAKGVSLIAKYTIQEKTGAGDSNDIVKDIWMNLTGSLQKSHVVSALKVLSYLPFNIYECCPGKGDCLGDVKDWLKERCSDKDNRDRK
ncbi:MAG: hypothetical protein F7C36_02710 [Desulfurococcales archaeon]|nr:hypothetical protein [Desulfurococcales archaeon]